VLSTGSPTRVTVAEAEATVSPQERAVLDLLDVDDLRSLAVDLVRASGQNPPGEEAATAAVLADACATRGLHCEVVEVEPGRPNVSGVLPGGSGPGLLLLGHSDVVPVGDGWTVDPFGAEVRDGRLYGRGAADMKGGLAACIVAMTALKRSGVRLSGPVELAVVVDEEETGKGVRHYLASSDRSAFAGCVVAEPTDLQTIVAARGDSYIEVSVHGRAAHSGDPSQGANAIQGAAAVVRAIEDSHAGLASRAHPLVGPATWSVGLVRGGSGTSTVPAECTLVVDRRLLPGETGDQAVDELVARIAGLDLPGRGLCAQVRLAMEMPGFETPADHPLVRAADSAVTAAGGPGLPLGGWTAACDGGFVARDAGVPVVVLGPGSVATQAHRADESVALDDLVTAARAYILLALRLPT
jgi:acetylornithine deacetylase